MFAVRQSRLSGKCVRTYANTILLNHMSLKAVHFHDLLRLH